MPDWMAARSQVMLNPNITNLNTGSFGPTPKPVFERVTELRKHLASAPWDFIVRATPSLLWKARTRLAEFIGASRERLVFAQNVSTAINIVATGIKLRSPGSILISDREYQAMHYCWERVAKQKQLEIKTYKLPLMPSEPGEIVSAIERGLDANTRLLFFSHVYSATGLITPAKEICALARHRGVVTVVDGAHAPAMIPLDIDDINADFYAGNCHKWLLAPIGVGFMVFHDHHNDRVEPLQVSWGYPRDPKRGPDEPDEFGSTPRIRQLEFEGTRDICPWLVVPESIEFQSKLGWDNIRARMAELQAFVHKTFDPIFRRTTPDDPDMHGAMSSYWIPTDESVEEVREKLWRHRIEVPITEWPDGRMMRISTHWYTTEEEIERLKSVFV